MGDQGHGELEWSLDRRENLSFNFREQGEFLAPTEFSEVDGQTSEHVTWPGLIHVHSGRH